MSLFRIITILTGFHFLTSVAFAQFPTDPRSDSVHIDRQTIRLTITDFVGKTIDGSSDIHFSSKKNGVRGIYLDLLDFTVDSVKINGTQIPFLYNDSLVKIPFTSAMDIGDSAIVTVWYKGLAQQGSGGWGGFYWSQGIAFNMGVTLYDVPHNAGRFWFPCFDNFTEKSLYELYITTQGTHSAICGGTLIGMTDNVDLTKTWHWKLHDLVPSYLVSVAVGPLVNVNKVFSGLNGQIPVILAAVASDTTAMKNSFLHLENSFHIYEQFYGPYLWERIGYVSVPFNGGAMEHATNIAYQKTLIDGALTYETVMAHELSHHWWGDLITCETAEDMWMNEGMAVFSEYLFTEQLYGRPAAIADIRNSHNNVIRTAHTSDGGYQPLSGMPQEHTYGTHTYDKGGNVAWSLRGYMGDSSFFKGLRGVLNRYKFSNLDAPKFSDVMSDSSGYDVHPFFDDWITQPGFAEFLLDSFTVQPAGNQFSVSVNTSQRLRHADHLYNQVPLEITFVAQNRNQVSRILVHSGLNSNDEFIIPFEPVAVFINRSEKLFYAVTADEREIKATGNTSLSYSNFRLNTTSIPANDSALVRSEYHWAKPDGNTQHQWKYDLTPDRFWKIDGIFPTGFKAIGTFFYDGSSGGPDNPIIYLEDSVVLFYRPNSGAEWAPASDYTINKQIANDKKGNITTPLKKGEYCIGSKRATVSVVDPKSSNPTFKIFPNPSDGLFSILIEEKTSSNNYQFSIFDVSGKMLVNKKLNGENSFDYRHILSAGKYTVKLFLDNKVVGSSSLIIKK
jgi:aminopeptidase N